MKNRVAYSKNSKVNDINLNYIYLFEITSEDEVFHKVGITYQSPLKRMENIKCTSNKRYNCKLIWSTDKSIKTFNAVEIERYILKLYFNNKYLPKVTFSGYTECYNFKDINTVIANLEFAIQDKYK